MGLREAAIRRQGRKRAVTRGHDKHQEAAKGPVRGGDGEAGRKACSTTIFVEVQRKPLRETTTILLRSRDAIFKFCGHAFSHSIKWVAMDAKKAAMEWPNHFPDGCPSPQIPDAGGDVFRLTKKPSLVIREDFRSHAEKCPGKGKGCVTCADQTPCVAAALSCYLTFDAAKEALKSIPRFSGIARASLSADDGKVGKTGTKPSHYSLWLRTRALDNALSLFAVEQQ